MGYVLCQRLITSIFSTADMPKVKRNEIASERRRAGIGDQERFLIASNKHVLCHEVGRRPKDDDDEKETYANDIIARCKISEGTRTRPRPCLVIAF